jgi:hypothetical protein
MHDFDDESPCVDSVRSCSANGADCVRYTVWSRGRLIGETDLGFFRLIEQSRSGWFHPNADGEKVMPVIASVLPAMRAYLHRDKVDAAGDPLVHPAMYGSTAFADLAEAFQHLSSLELELRREDGSVVPTSEIGIQDTEQLLALADELDDDVGPVSWDADDELLELTECDLQLEADMMHDVDLVEDALGRIDEPSVDWSPEDLEEHRFPRYQIHVLLHDGDAIP